MLKMDVKYYVEVKQAERGMKPSKEALEVLKNAVSGKMLSKMKKEYVDCPVVGSQVPFIDCFACVSFIRRVKGVVHCAGVEKRLKT